MQRRPTLKSAINATGQAPLLSGESFLPAETAAVAQPDARCSVLVRVSDDVRRRLKMTAIQRGATVQTLLLEAIATILDEPNSARKP